MHDPGRYDAILAEHKALTDLIDAGDTQAAADTLTAHLAATKAALTAL
jgi:DNA-binding GntR family transcriptional regulator